MFITLKTPRNTILIEPWSQNMFDCSSLMIVDDRIFEIKKNNKLKMVKKSLLIFYIRSRQILNMNKINPTYLRCLIPRD